MFKSVFLTAELEMFKKVNIGIIKRLLKRQASGLLVFQSFLIAVILVSLVVAAFRYQRTSFLTLEPKGVGRRPADFSIGSLIKETKPLSFYTDMTAARDIFHLTPVENNVSTTSDNTGGSSDAAKFAARYIVQGIILDKDPRVIIKDTQSMKTYFLRLKQSIDGATLTDIKGSHVIFNLAGETLELIKK